VLGGIAPAPPRQVSDGGDAAWIAALDGARRTHDRADQLLGREVRVARPPRFRDHVSVTVEGQQGGSPERPVRVSAYRRAAELERQRPGATAEHTGQKQRDGG
jgi:hypothetical protein